MRVLLASTASVVAFGYFTPVLAQSAAAPPAQGVNQIEELIVTAERREESLQTVPISVSAFTQANLKTQQIAGGRDLQTGIPNVTFSKGSRGDNFQIRGIGSNGLSVAGDSGTGVHIDSLPTIDNRLFEMDFFDVTRVEVLRGPQGTLYGRNSTGGTINIIPATPSDRLEGMIEGELGNYKARQLTAMVNVPIAGEKAGLRLAGIYLDRGGFNTNTAGGPKLDGRKQGAFRATFAVNPIDRIHASLMWQHFGEDDNRLTTPKAVCVADPGPSAVGGVAVTNPLVRGFLSQGCANQPVAGSNGFPNSLTTIHGAIAATAGIGAFNLYPTTVSSDVSTVTTSIPPTYKADENIYKFNLDIDLLENLQLKYTYGRQTNNTDSNQDFALVNGTVPFTSTAVSPGGVVNDPQFGSFNTLFAMNQVKRKSSQDTHELVLQSSFNGPVNFSLGGIVIDYDLENDVIIYSNAFTAQARNLNGNVPCAITTPTCVYIDPNSPLDNSGHNYYRSRTPYTLKSKGAFGEVYWNVTPTLRVAGGLRYTDERKSIPFFPLTFLTPGSLSGVVPGVPPVVNYHSSAVTGRATVDWKPELSFTDSTLVYGSFSRGFKGGGPNNAGSPASAPTFAPEFVNAFELGMKNTLLDGQLTLNLAAFYNDFKGYQYSTSVNRIFVIQNADAVTKGFELESVWRPANGVRLNVAAGYLSTDIKGGSAIDSFRQTQDDPNFTLVKNGTASACIVPTAALANFLNIIDQRPGSPTVAGVSGVPLAISRVCSGAFANLGLVTSSGNFADLKGKELPSSPHYTVSLGAQYQWELTPGWKATVRGDFFHQIRSYARPFNDLVDEIPGWSNVNLLAKVQNEGGDLTVSAYVKNVGGKRAVTGYLFNDAALGLLPRLYLRDPRTFGLSVQKTF